MEELEFIDVRKKEITRVYRETIVDLFITQNLNASEVATKLGVSISLIRQWLKKFNIKKPKELKEARKRDTCLKRYGVLNPMQSREFQEKHKNTCLKRYGATSTLSIKEFQDKAKATNLKKYGAENIFASDYGRCKIKETLWSNYQVDNPMKAPAIKERARNTSICHYGVKHPMQSPIIQSKFKATNLKRYGFTCALGNLEIKKKAENTCIKKYGAKTFLGSSAGRRMRDEKGISGQLSKQEIREKVKKTNLQKYGVPYYTQSPEMVQKSQETMLRKYGEKHALEIPLFKEKAHNTLQEHYGTHSILALPNFYATWRKQVMLEKYGVENNSQVHLSQETLGILHDKDKMSSFISTYLDKPTTYQMANDLKCSYSCVSNNVKKLGLMGLINTYHSHGEQELYELFPTEHRNVRDVIFKELDLYYPIEKVALEFNGTYWHSTRRIPEKNYHYNKYLQCYKKGVRLIQVYEYLWNLPRNRELLTTLIARTLQKETKVYNMEELSLKRVFPEVAHTLEVQWNIRPNKNIIDAVQLIIEDRPIMQVSINTTNYITFTYVGNVDVIEGAKTLLYTILEKYNHAKYLADLDIDDVSLYYRLGFVPTQGHTPNAVIVDNSGNIVYNETNLTYRIEKSGLQEMTCSKMIPEH